MQVYEGGRVRTCDLGIKSPQATPRNAPSYSGISPDTPSQSPSYIPEAHPIIAQRPTVCHTALRGPAGDGQ